MPKLHYILFICFQSKQKRRIRSRKRGIDIHLYSHLLLVNIKLRIRVMSSPWPKLAYNEVSCASDYIFIFNPKYKFIVIWCSYGIINISIFCETEVKITDRPTKITRWKDFTLFRINKIGRIWINSANYNFILR